MALRAMHATVETLIGQLATDARLRRRFTEGPAALLAELSGRQGLELTPVELEALAATDPAALRSFAGALDRRLRKTTPNPTEEIEP
jgi:hypothetical protein